MSLSNTSLILIIALLCYLLTLTEAAGLQVNLGSYLNAKTASTGLNDTLADFDGFGRALPVEHLPKATSFVYQGVEFHLPPFQNESALDTVRAASQVISLPENTGFHSLHLLATAVTQTGHPAENRDYARGNVNFTFADGSSSSTGFVIGGWWNDNPFNGPIQTPFFYANATIDEGKTIEWNTSTIGYVTVRVPSSQPLQSITLPSADNAIDVFALTLLEASRPGDSAVLTVQNVRPTTRWLNSGASGSERFQVIEIILNNLAPLDTSASAWLTTPHNVTITSNALDTVVPGRVVRLRTNDQITVKVGVKVRPGVKVGSNVDVMVKLIPDRHHSSAATLDGRTQWTIPVGIEDWRNEDSSLRTHEPPDWYEDGKFGIFIHWGVYAVPAWAPSGKQYAEWYDWQLHVPANDSSPTWVHHKETYGENVVYDDFIANWTASNWNPDNWTDLFAAAGAKYFVLTSKHHDGFALFDTGKSSDRNSIQLGPKRDIVKDLFSSAKSRHPELHRGVYFSLPEWYNPAYGPYGRRDWPGHPALNAYTGECCDPFIGYVEVDDFIEDIQKPQMETLFYEYDTDILWCDIGGPSAFPAIGGDWYNYAASQGRQVVMNNRCGANQSDFVTPEYTTFASPPFQKWETNAGLDPFSYGYNSDTPPQNYQNASSIITELIDIVSKNGNFLLDIGPMADGTVIPEEREPLLQVGEWLSKAGDAIYETRPWFIQPAAQTEGLTNVRFTTTTSAFYIIALSRPENGTLQTTAPVPILEGDKVHLLGGSGAVLSWTVDWNGVLSVDVPDSELDLVNLPAWAFQVVYA